jgi:3-methyl-2-oxobutanoate hydroxymethyltransferase
MKHGKITKGKLFNEAQELIKGAILIDKIGADLVILEKIPGKISRIITQSINIPTIGIGAGKFCDGQVLIINDLLGISERKYKHAPEYIKMRELMIKTIIQYKHKIENGFFLSDKQTNIINDSEYSNFTNWCLKNDIIV